MDLSFHINDRFDPSFFSAWKQAETSNSYPGFGIVFILDEGNNQKVTVAHEVVGSTENV